MSEERHTPLTVREQLLFAGLADPEKEANPEDCTSEQALRMLSVARLHGVLPIVWRKFRTMPSTSGFGDAFKSEMRSAGDMVAIMAGQSLLLRHHSRSIIAAFAEAGIPVAIVKGPVFAERLYRVASDRPFTDIDLLTAPENLAKANAALPSLGFVSLTKRLGQVGQQPGIQMGSLRQPEHPYRASRQPRALRLVPQAAVLFLY